MAPRKRNTQTRGHQWVKGASATLMALTLAFALAVPPTRAQSGGSQSPQTSQPPAQDIPDAPSSVQPPDSKPKFPDSIPPGSNPTDQPGSSTSAQPSDADKPAPEPIAPAGPAPSTGPRNQ